MGAADGDGEAAGPPASLSTMTVALGQAVKGELQVRSKGRFVMCIRSNNDLGLHIHRGKICTVTAISNTLLVLATLQLV